MCLTGVRHTDAAVEDSVEEGSAKRARSAGGGASEGGARASKESEQAWPKDSSSCYCGCLAPDSESEGGSDSEAEQRCSGMRVTDIPSLPRIEPAPGAAKNLSSTGVARGCSNE